MLQAPRQVGQDVSIAIAIGASIALRPPSLAIAVVLAVLSVVGSCYSPGTGLFTGLDANSKRTERGGPGGYLSTPRTVCFSCSHIRTRMCAHMHPRTSCYGLPISNSSCSRLQLPSCSPRADSPSYAHGHAASRQPSTEIPPRSLAGPFLCNACNDTPPPPWTTSCAVSFPPRADVQ